MKYALVPADVAWDLIPYDFAELGRVLEAYLSEARSQDDRGEAMCVPVRDVSRRFDLWRVSCL